MEFEKTIEESRKEASDSICHIMEYEYGFSAMHPGVSPVEWLGPAGMWSKVMWEVAGHFSGRNR
jgi:hypothetical protein